MISSKNLLLRTLTIFIIISVPLATGCGLFYDFDREENNKQDLVLEGTSVKETGQNRSPFQEENTDTGIEIEDSDHEGDVGESSNGSPEKDSYNNPGYMVVEVIDGDTIVLSNGERIRFLGMNTPEEGMYFYAEARDVLEIMILGKEVLLEKDISDYDQYGRKLRYVYHKDIFVNLEMVKRGFANIFTYPPDVKYSDKFLEAERYARENDLGLWKSSIIDTVSIDVFFNAQGNDNKNINGEFVILENIGSEILDTSNWTIKDSGTNIYRFGSYKFNPDTRIILFSGEGKDRIEDDDVWYLFWKSPRPVWNNDHDTLYLRDKEGLLVEIYNY
ncbi:thermonuclease family protein [Actinomycetota bacterium]